MFRLPVFQTIAQTRLGLTGALRQPSLRRLGSREGHARYVAASAVANTGFPRTKDGPSCLRLQERINDPHTADLVAVAQILGIELATTERGGGGDNGAVPVGDAMPRLDL